METGTYGFCDFEVKPNRIVIDADLSLEDFTKTLAHEIIHFMFYRLNLDVPDLLEEQLCETTVIPLFENLQISLSPQQKKAFLNLQKIQ